ncbi:hypothetical protein E2C01_088245 [Portunus trituberculatus]|uniref:Uncharacterized protein n=1 Tax=Portunus trituberculatus TaxID=210409 RepID=A0A5B7JFF6_PORTR|nr:hypothetical protein [Portunus trituberculatus]
MKTCHGPEGVNEMLSDGPQLRRRYLLCAAIPVSYDTPSYHPLCPHLAKTRLLVSLGASKGLVSPQNLPFKTSVQFMCSPEHTWAGISTCDT